MSTDAWKIQWRKKQKANELPEYLQHKTVMDILDAIFIVLRKKYNRYYQVRAYQ